MPGLDLSDIQLPEADAEKPHGSDVTPLTPEQEAEQAKIQQKQADDAAAAEAAKSGDQKPKDPPEQTPAPDGGTGDAAPVEKDKDGNPITKPEGEAKPKDGEEPGKKDDLTPFHQHPDWVKMKEKADKAEKLEVEIAEMKGKLEGLMVNKDVTPERKEEARKTADQRLQDDIENGWQPTSQAELLIRGLKYMQEDLDKKTEEKIKATEQEKENAAQLTEDERNGIINGARSAYEELQIEDVEVRKSVGKYLAELQIQGIIAPITSQNVAVAIKWGVDQMKKTGQFPEAKPAVTTPTPDPKPTVTDESKDKQDAQKKAQDAINGKVLKPAGDGKPGEKQKKSYAEMHNRSLDQITFDAAKQLE